MKFYEKILSFTIHVFEWKLHGMNWIVNMKIMKQ